MALNYFIGKTEAWLEAQLGLAQEDLAAGRVVTRVSAGDTESGETIEVNVKERIEMLLNALNALNPTDYPASSVRRVRRTRVQMYQDLGYGFDATSAS